MFQTLTAAVLKTYLWSQSNCKIANWEILSSCTSVNNPLYRLIICMDTLSFIHIMNLKNFEFLMIFLKKKFFWYIYVLFVEIYVFLLYFWMKIVNKTLKKINTSMSRIIEPPPNTSFELFPDRVWKFSHVFASTFVSKYIAILRDKASFCPNRIV